MDRIYVVGTDTDVGKTVLSLLLMQFFLQHGRRPFYLKPVQTGCTEAADPAGDAAFIYRHVASLRGKNPAASVGYCFAKPKAPFFAARDAGRSIDLAWLDGIIEEKSRLFTHLILEAAGGLLVPVTEQTFMIDMIKHTGARPILAARAGLGTINHTLLSLEALRRRDLSPAGIVFLDNADTPPDMIAENREAVERHGGLPVAGVIGKIIDFSRPPAACYAPLEFIFGDAARYPAGT